MFGIWGTRLKWGYSERGAFVRVGLLKNGAFEQAVGLCGANVP